MMMARRMITMLALVAVAAIPVAAGEHKKCTMSTQECLNMMAEKMKKSGWVGVELDVEATGGQGYKVEKVIPGSPAEKAGIQPGDVLYALNGVTINEDNKEALKKVRKEWIPGQSVTYTIKRAGADRDVTLTLAPMPADVMANWVGQHMLDHAQLEIASAK